MKRRRSLRAWSRQTAISLWCSDGLPASSSHQTRETAMPACTRRAVAMVTDVLTSDDLDATARRTGFVQRASKMTGKRFLALVTCGTWREANTTLAPLAAKITPRGQQGSVSPEALHQRMPKKAMAFLRARLRQARAQVQALDHVCDAGLLTAFTPVYRADRTGFGLPDACPTPFPAPAGVRPKRAPTCKRCGTIRTVSWGMVR